MAWTCSLGAGLDVDACWSYHDLRFIDGSMIELNEQPKTFIDV